MNCLLTCDIDLHRIHLYHATDEEVVLIDGNYAQFLKVIRQLSAHYSVVLAVESASPILYRGVIQNSTMRWLVFNLATCGMIAKEYEKDLNVSVSFSPSNKWTKGWTEVRRHKLAGAMDEAGFNKEQNHNIREMKAMAWMFRREPSLWTDMKGFLSCL
jgi:hypothetical protein